MSFIGKFRSRTKTTNTTRHKRINSSLSIDNTNGSVFSESTPPERAKTPDGRRSDAIKIQSPPEYPSMMMTPASNSPKSMSDSMVAKFSSPNTQLHGECSASMARVINYLKGEDASNDSAVPLSRVDIMQQVASRSATPSPDSTTSEYLVEQDNDDDEPTQYSSSSSLVISRVLSKDNYVSERHCHGPDVSRMSIPPLPSLYQLNHSATLAPETTVIEYIDRISGNKITVATTVNVTVQKMTHDCY